MFDTQNQMLGGGALLAIALYAGTSMYVTGPLVAERLVHKSGWHQSCQRSVQSDIRSKGSVSSVTPQINCNALLRNLDPAIGRMMNMFGAGAACQMMDVKRRQQEAFHHLKQARLEAVASRAGSRCQCAVGALIEKRRLSVALHAGSARLIAPSVINNLNGELTAALHTPHCAAITQAGPNAQGGAS